MFFAGGLEKGLFPAGYQKKAGIRNGELDGTGHGLDPLKQLFALVAEALRGHDGCHLGRDLIFGAPRRALAGQREQPQGKDQIYQRGTGFRQSVDMIQCISEHGGIHYRFILL